MRKVTFLFFVFFIPVLGMAQAVNFPCPEISWNGNVCTKRDDRCFTKSTVQYGTVYSSFDYPVGGPDTLPMPITLWMNIYAPVGTSGQGRPFILLMHGGGLRVGCKDGAGMKRECEAFARRGFVAATIDYRLGWVPDPVTCESGSTIISDPGDNNDTAYDEVCAQRETCSPCDRGTLKDQQYALYRAVQDAHAALRFIVGSGAAATYNIDVNNIYVGGQSAGSIAAIALTYIQQADFKDLFGLTEYANVKATMGLLDTSGNDYTNSFIIRGVYNNWGGISDLKYIEDKSKDRIPMISFHGQCDEIVPYDSGYSNGGCQSLGKVYGSKAIYNKMAGFVTNTIPPHPSVSLSLNSGAAGHGILECDSGVAERVRCAINFFKSNSLGNITHDINEHLPDSCYTNYNCNYIPGSFSRASKIAGNVDFITPAIYPNPTSGTITCAYTLMKQSTVSIEVRSILSQLIYSNKQVKPAGKFSSKLPVQLKRGTYTITIVTAEGTYSQKIICQ